MSIKTTKNYCLLNGPSHQCQYYTESRVCLHPDGPDVNCEFYTDKKNTGKVCDNLFEETRMCKSKEAQNGAKAS